MIKQRIVSLILVSLSLLPLSFIAFMMLPSLLGHEYYRASVNYTGTDLAILVPSRNQHVGRWTDVLLTFKNSSLQTCAVTVDSRLIHIGLQLDSGMEYGLFLPKDEDVTLLFCGIQKDIRFDK